MGNFPISYLVGMDPQTDRRSLLSLPPRKGITIALDGHAGCGKSTLAADLSRHLGFGLVDTGAMYRAVTWCVGQFGVDPGAVADWTSLLDSWNLRFTVSGGIFGVTVSGQAPGAALRGPEVSAGVSAISAIPAVRAWLVRRQQALARQGSVVLEGRDIATVVAPDAEVRFYVTADLEVRVQRRYLEMRASGLEISPEQVAENLKARDDLDTRRADSPLQPAPGIVWLDTSRMTRESQLQIALGEVRRVQQSRPDGVNYL